MERNMIAQSKNMEQLNKQKSVVCELNAEKEKLKAECVEKDLQMKKLKNWLENLRNENEKVKTNQNEKTGNLNKLKREVLGLKAEKAKLNSQCCEKDLQVKSLKNLLENLRNENEKVKTDQNETMEQLNKWKREVDLLKEEREKIKADRAQDYEKLEFKPNYFDITLISLILFSLPAATRLLPGGGGPVQFSEPRYCILLAEDSPPSISVTQVSASHRDGASVRYSITGGNRDGLFTIDQHTGLITLAAPLDFESHPKHELVVAAEAGGRTVHTIVQVSVEDINDNPPHFLEDNLQVTVLEEEDTDLPATIVRVLAEDPDRIDEGRLVYSVGGEGVDDHDPKKAFFTINPHSGELILLRVVDTNTTSLVTPRLTRARDCHAHSREVDFSCTPTSCLNGGRCVRNDQGNR
ncbi:cadherin-related hmr-1-like [Palaemon carinicauda]|uniref:cadherin-related hmr-1-like n=1 Tax=Palaemon carinicauda TaxID=392227 RepID=UPI0035B65443